MAELQIHRGDITKLHVEAIVNAANQSLLGGGGVDGAIHRAAGKELLAACEQLGGCATGDAKATPGFRLPAQWVFHAVGPRWKGGTKGEDDLLAGCYRKCMQLARDHRCRSIAFPAISTGIYHFPPERAARLAIASVRAEIGGSSLERVIFCCFSEDVEHIYRTLLPEAK